MGTGDGSVATPELIAVALVVEEGLHGSTVAPLAKTILETYLDETGAPRLNELSERGGSPPLVLTRASRPLASAAGEAR